MKKSSKTSKDTTKLTLATLTVRRLATRELLRAQGGRGSDACDEGNEGTGSYHPPC